MELLRMKRTVVVVVLVWLDITLTSVVVLEVVGAAGVGACPPPQIQHMPDAVKSVSSKSLADSHQKELDA
jgi:hypothetical protein